MLKKKKKKNKRQNMFQLISHPCSKCAQDEILGTFSNKDATPMPTTKNNSKYNNCTLECIELGTCTELSLKLEREKIFLEFSGLQGRNNR